MSTSRRHSTVPVRVRQITVGGDAPVVVQSMTNTDTVDAAATAAQIAELWQAGSELVRISVNTREAAAKVSEIRHRLDDLGADVPLIGDFHYNGHLLLREYPDCARELDKYRINPGNLGRGDSHDDNFATMIAVARDHDRPVRIGVNAGSLDQDLLAAKMDENARRGAPQSATAVKLATMVESARQSAAAAEQLGLPHDRIILSCKISNVPDLIQVYTDLATACDYPLHLGLTEAGMGIKGTVSSAVGLGVLLQRGIGDTVRVSLTPTPGGSRTEEVRVAQQILQTLGHRNFHPQVTACPGCGRTTSTYFQELAAKIEEFLLERMPVWRAEHPRAAELRVAVMGCVVNGPGESKAAHIGISLPGTGEAPRAPLFIDGERVGTLQGEDLIDQMKARIEDYVAKMTRDRA